jgi:uncharacterized protein (TIGR02145 family)
MKPEGKKMGTFLSRVQPFPLLYIFIARVQPSETHYTNRLKPIKEVHMSWLSNYIAGTFLIFFFLLIFPFPSKGQSVLETNCDNSNFSRGNFDNWEGCYGFFSVPCIQPGFLLDSISPQSPHPLHRILHEPGWYDYNSCDSLITVYPGESFVARIGDSAVSGDGISKEAELKYAVTVNEAHSLFIYRYAVVLQSGNHPANQQPDFDIMITDSSGVMLDPVCGYYHITCPYSNPPLGWHSCSYGIFWKDWTTVGMDLSGYTGQTVYIKFKVRGCFYDTHFGYAYVSAYCGYLRIKTVLCSGDSLATLTAPPGFSYLWSTVNGDTTINGDTTATITVPHPQGLTSYSCLLTASNGCQVTITDTLSYTSIYSNFTYSGGCLTDSVQFYDSTYVSQNQVTNWIWDFGDGSPLVIGVNNPSHQYASAGTYLVKLISFSTEGCSDSISKFLSISALPDVTTKPLNKSICSSENTNIILTSSVPGTNFYWIATLISGTVTGFGPDSGLVINQILINPTAGPGVVIYHITPKSGTCFGDTIEFQVTVFPQDSVNIAITASANDICSGTMVTYTANPTNPGSSPSYQWQVNGINTGTNNPLLTYIPVSGDLVSCILTSSDTVCPTNNPATSNTITMIVNPNLPVSVSIVASSNPFCPGSSVTFTATPTNGGTTPQYQWIVNGVNVGTNSPIYSYNPASADLVSCMLTSSEPCTTGNPASSIQVLMIENTSFPAGVSIAANPNPFCPGATVNYTATPANGGTAPSYQWKVNGINAGPNSPNFSYSPQPGDSISCVMTSNLACVSNNPVWSNRIIMVFSPVPVVTFTACFDTVTTLNAKPIKLKGGIPLGGTYAGPGVNSTTGVFTPLAAGLGTKVITYSYTNAALCSANKTKTIIVQVIPVFSCGNNLADIRDNKIYPTVQIGSQCWMAANLDFGVQISELIHQRDNCVPEKYKSAVGSSQSAVYQWDEMMLYDNTPGLQGICPPAWHVPTETEWNTLFSNWMNSAFAAAPLKYSGYSGFNAFLFGARHLNVQWDYQNFAVFFWSSTSYGPYKAWAHGMNDPDYSVSYYPSLRSNAFSVRCIRD